MYIERWPCGGFIGFSDVNKDGNGYLDLTFENASMVKTVFAKWKWMGNQAKEHSFKQHRFYLQIRLEPKAN
jgi:hypothetical protein